jgi:CBS domain-containing protein
MLMLSELRRFRVRDRRGARARLQDVAVALLEAEYPPATRVIYSCDGGRLRSLKWDAVRGVSLEAKEVEVEGLDAGREVSPDSFKDEVLLVRDVLDALVLDLQNRRATRANDLALEVEGGKLRLRAADTSARALLRRLSRGLFAEPPEEALYDWMYVEFLRGDPGAVRSGAGEHLRVARLQPGEIARLASALPYMHAAELLKLIPDPLAARTLELMTPERQLQVFEELDEDEALKMLALMSPDDAADLVGRLNTPDARRYLERMPKEKSALVIELLRYPEDTAGGVMTNEFVCVPSQMTAQEAREHLRERLSETAFSLLVYAVDDEESRRLQGLLSLRNLIVADAGARVEEFMDAYATTLAPLEPAGAAARRVINSHLPAMPVVGKDGRLLGVVTFDTAVMIAAPTSWSAQAPRRVFT